MGFEFENIQHTDSDMVPKGYYVRFVISVGEPFCLSTAKPLHEWYSIGEALHIGTNYRLEISEMHMKPMKGCTYSTYVDRIVIKLSVIGDTFFNNAVTIHNSLSKILWGNITLIKLKSPIIDLYVDYSDSLIDDGHEELLTVLHKIITLVPLDFTAYPSYNLIEGSNN